MRRWLAVLAFMPALAWGDCMSPEMRSDMTQLALSLQGAIEDGMPERDLLAMANGIDEPGTQAAIYVGVQHLASQRNGISLSAVVTHMQIACENATRQPPRH